MSYNVTANVIDILMIVVNGAIMACEDSIPECKPDHRRLQQILRALNIDEVREGFEITFDALENSTLATEVKQHYMQSMATMQNDIMIRIQRSELKSDINVEGIMLMSKALRDEISNIKSKLTTFMTRIKSTYLRGGSYKSIFHQLGSLFTSVFNVMPSTVYIDVLNNWMDDPFIVCVDEVMRRTKRLVCFICSLVDASPEIIRTGTCTARVYLNDIRGFSLTKYIANPVSCALALCDHAREVFGHAAAEVKQYTVNDRDPMERLRQYNDDAGLYYPNRNNTLTHRSYKSTISEERLNEIYDMVFNEFL